MRRKTIKLSLLFILVFPIYSLGQTNIEFFNLLSEYSELTDVDALDSNIYPEKYVAYITNPLDWSEPEKGTFKSRIILCYRGLECPTVIVTEGYYANYALYPNYEEELSHLFNTNVIVCEHRYYGKSVPDSLDWQYLTVDNALSDIHHVRTLFGNIFKGKWISTGISKGGQTTMFYRVKYPDDVDVSVSYVAPLNRGVEDGRHEPFLAEQVGTPSEREQLLNTQRELLKRKPQLLPLFKEYTQNHKYQYQCSIETVYDYCVLELPFAFWQWGTSFDKIPSLSSSDEEWFRFMIKISEPDYFSYPTPTTPFFVQAAYELGYYGYSLEGLTDILSITDSHNYLSALMLPPDAKSISFNKSLYERTVNYLKNNDPKHIFIYGENDPWSASGVCTWLDCSSKENMRIYVQPRGSHTSRIRSMPNSKYKEIMSRLTNWLQ